MLKDVVQEVDNLSEQVGIQQMEILKKKRQVEMLEEKNYNIREEYYFSGLINRLYTIEKIIRELKTN